MIIYEGLLCRYRTVHTFYSVFLFTKKRRPLRTRRFLGVTFQSA